VREGKGTVSIPSSVPLAANPPDQQFPAATTTLGLPNRLGRRAETRAEEREGFINEQWSGRIWQGRVSLGTALGDPVEPLALVERSTTHSSTKWDWMNWIVRADFPTPPPPTTTSLYSRKNCACRSGPAGPSQLPQGLSLNHQSWSCVGVCSLWSSEAGILLGGGGTRCERARKRQTATCLGHVAVLTLFRFLLKVCRYSCGCKRGLDGSRVDKDPVFSFRSFNCWLNLWSASNPTSQAQLLQ
jgi:hypothetical protein